MDTGLCNSSACTGEVSFVVDIRQWTDLLTHARHPVEVKDVRARMRDAG